MPQTLYKTIKFASAISDLTPPAHPKLDQGVNDASQICPKYVNYVCFFSCKFRTFPVTEGNEI